MHSSREFSSICLKLIKFVIFERQQWKKEYRKVHASYAKMNNSGKPSVANTEYQPKAN